MVVNIKRRVSRKTKRLNYKNRQINQSGGFANKPYDRIRDYIQKKKTT